jgi:AcrR family transcriptional regulator
MLDVATRPSPAIDLRADIVEAATRVFSERGYHAASMTEIADVVGIRKPSLYHHVRKKEDLLFAIHDQLIEELIAETTAVVSSSTSPAAKLRGVLDVTMQFIARHRDGVKVFLQERHVLTADRWQVIVAKRDFYERMVAQVIREGTASGSFVEIRADIAARGVIAMANWAYTWFQPEQELSAGEVGSLFADIALRGLEVR